MNSYAYVLRVTKTGRLPEVQVQTGAIYCHTFGEAAHIAMTDASMPWDEKRAKRELISIVKVDL